MRVVPQRFLENSFIRKSVQDINRNTCCVFDLLLNRDAFMLSNLYHLCMAALVKHGAIRAVIITQILLYLYD